MTDLAKRLGVSQPAVSNRLRNLLKDGWIHQKEHASKHGALLHYEPRPGLTVQWVAPEKGITIEWTHHTEIDWRFPLVSQIPDPETRDTVKTYLQSLGRIGLLYGSQDGRSP